MRNLLFRTAAAAALAGFAGVASAQTTQGPSTGPGAGTAAKTENTRPAESKGALSGALKGDTTGSPKAQATGPEPAQESSPSVKPGQALGQDQPKQMTSPRNAEEEKPNGKTQTGEGSDAVEQHGAQEQNSKSNANSAQENSTKSSSSHGSVQLSQSQRTKIQSIVGKSSGARVNHVDFDVSVGVKIPSDVHVEVLPEEVVEVVPQFRGYDFIIVGDNILIVDPDTLEIVDIIAA